MRRIQIEIHPLSACLGAVVFAVVALVASAVQVGQERPLRVTVVGPVEVPADPSPFQYVHIMENQPFTVPQGKRLVVTGLAANEDVGTFLGGPANKAARVVLQFDGQVILQLGSTIKTVEGGAVGLTGSGPALHAVPPGLAAQENVVVSVVGAGAGGGNGIALGYLVDA